MPAMIPTALALTAFLFATDPTPDTSPMRKPHPLAPSLNQLSDEEEAKTDEIINRFIKADTGQLKGEEAKQAQRDFEALGPDAIPALIRGLNRASHLDHSCPTLMIAKKLARMLQGSDDQKLLDFARDEIGTPRNKHAGIMAELRTMCQQRKNALARANPPTPSITTGANTNGPKTPRTMTNAELMAAASKEGGTQLKTLLAEMEQRKAPEVLAGFSSVIKNNDIDTQQYVRDLMDRNMARQTVTVLREKLKDTDVEIRRSALRVASNRPSFLANLIEALGDDQAEVREDAHKGLLKWNKREDYGPTGDADKKQIEEAQAKWRDWLMKRERR
jgi:hypothetical protein